MAQSAPGKGYYSYMQLGRESTFNTYIASTHKYEIISCDFSPTVDVIPDPSLYNQMSRRAWLVGATMYHGKIKLRATYSSMPMLLDWVMGTSTFGAAGGIDAGAGPYTHTFKDLALLNSYSLEICYAGISASNKVMRFIGAKCLTMTFKATAGTGEGALMTVECDVLAQTNATEQTPTAALNTWALEPIYFYQVESSSVNAGTSDSDTTPGIFLKDWELTINTGMTADRYLLGTLGTAEPIRNDFVSSKWKFTREFNSLSDWTNAKALTVGTLNIKFTNGLGTTNLRALQFTSTAAYQTAYSLPIDKYGIIVGTSTWESAYHATDTGSLAVVSTNNLATTSTAAP